MTEQIPPEEEEKKPYKEIRKGSSTKYMYFGDEEHDPSQVRKNTMIIVDPDYDHPDLWLTVAEIIRIGIMSGSKRIDVKPMGGNLEIYCQQFNEVVSI